MNQNHCHNMGEFSRFGTSSSEWQYHVKKCGPQPKTPTGDVRSVAIRRSTNAIREEASENQTKNERKW